MHVRRTLTREGGRYSLGEPKTKQSRRTVHLTSPTVGALRAHHKQQLEDNMKYRGLREDQGLVFTTQTGAPINPTNLRNRSFKKLLTRADLPEIRFHDLRHTAATLLFSNNVPARLVQETLGHTNVGTTLGIYSHVLPGMGEQVAEAMDSMLS